MRTVRTISSREFNQHASEAKKASSNGPVIITDRGRPAHVLLSIDEYRRITGQTESIVDLLAMEGDVSWEPPILNDRAQAADLS